MNMSWLSMIGGGITAAATLAVGISTSGIMAANPVDDSATEAAGETIYVEQPVIQVSDSGSPLAIASVDPIVIAILPAPSEPEMTLTPDPSMPAPSYEDGDEYMDAEEGEYEEGYEGEEEYEEEYEVEEPEEGDSD